MANLWCKIFFHKLKVVKGYDTIPGARKLYCERCKRFFAIHDGLKIFIPWDFELEDMHKLKEA